GRGWRGGDHRSGDGDVGAVRGRRGRERPLRPGHVLRPGAPARRRGLVRELRVGLDPGDGAPAGRGSGAHGGRGGAGGGELRPADPGVRRRGAAAGPVLRPDAVRGRRGGGRPLRRGRHQLAAGGGAVAGGDGHGAARRDRRRGGRLRADHRRGHDQPRLLGADRGGRARPAGHGAGPPRPRGGVVPAGGGRHRRGRRGLRHRLPLAGRSL
ncbi:MAG: hypothetical protein AVDCRST_MAG35-1492, partial [uncultured Quadrisphaera sp.]